MHKSVINKILTGCIALVWLLNGLFCKILNFVPRHQLILGRILGDEHSFVFIKIIGALEVAMVIWIMSNIKSRCCAIIQIIIIMTMNSIEIILAPDLLLYGRGNIFPALLLCSAIFCNEFYLKKKSANITIK